MSNPSQGIFVRSAVHAMKKPLTEGVKDVGLEVCVVQTKKISKKKLKKILR